VIEEADDCVSNEIKVPFGLVCEELGGSLWLVLSLSYSNNISLWSFNWRDVEGNEVYYSLLEIFQ
jgi:hypothetical protein